MKEKYLPNQKYYHFSTECYCGVVVDEKTMKRIQKVLYKAEAEIKQILHNSENVRPYSWTCVNLIGKNKEIEKQTIISYPTFEYAKDVNSRIDNLKLTTPKYIENFYEISNSKELDEVKKDILAELEEIRNEN